MFGSVDYYFNFYILKHKKMRTTLKVIIGLLVLIFIAFVTKPSDETCKEKASVEVEQKLKKEVNSDMNLVNRMIEVASANKVWVEDKILYKEINFTFDGKTRNIGYGMFGMVKIDTD